MKMSSEVPDQGDEDFYEATFYPKTGRPDEHVFTFEGFSYTGNIDKESHAHPYFTREVVDSMLDITPFIRWSIQFDEARDTYVCFDAVTRTEYLFKGEDIEVIDPYDFNSRNKEHVYQIGEGVIVWIEKIKCWEYVSRATCPYCGEEFREVSNTCEKCGRTVNF